MSGSEIVQSSIQQGPPAVEIERKDHADAALQSTVHDVATATKSAASQGSQHQPLEELTPEMVEEFRRDGFVFVPRELLWTEEQLKVLVDEVNQTFNWPDAPGKWMKYFEKNNLRGKPGHEDAPAKILQRVEFFLDYNDKLNELINGPRMLHMVSQLFGERAILFKEKVNYKLPGGQGFSPHQDASSGWWKYGQTLHISSLLSIDAADASNGALELVRGAHKQGLLCERWAGLSDEVSKNMKWEMAVTRPGDLVFFDSFVPHRSGPNFTDRQRTVVYTTYAKASEGDFRAQYHQEKRLNFPPDIERVPGKKYSYQF